MIRSAHLSTLATILLLSVGVTGCQDKITSPEPTNDSPATAKNPRSVSSTAQEAVKSQTDGCTSTGTGLTAKVVNKDVVGRTIDIGNCDVGAYFDENGVVKNATFKQPDASPSASFQRLVRADGARIEITKSEFTVNEEYEKRMVHITLRSGAKGVITGNTLTGRKKAGILLNDKGTSGVVQGNTVVGAGPRPAQATGIQVSFGASGTVKNNEVRDHWRTGARSFCSSGIAAPFAGKVTIARNQVTGNDCGVVVVKGSPNSVIHNTIEVSNDEGSPPVGFASGVLVAGSNNRVVQNEINGAKSAASGIWILGSFQGRPLQTTNNKLIGNRITGFVRKIRDGGSDTKIPPPFDPSE